MGVKDSFMGASVLAKVAIVLAMIANFFSWISFTTTSWMQVDTGTTTIHFGLWRTCNDEFISTSGCSLLDGHGDATFNAVQAFAVFGFVALNAGCLLLVLFMFKDTCKGNSETSLASAILLFVSGGCWLLAAIIFGAEYDEEGRDLHFSFAMAIIAAIISVIAGILVILARGGSTVTST